jgi:hypothetical protein
MCAPTSLAALRTFSGSTGSTAAAFLVLSSTILGKSKEQPITQNLERITEQNKQEMDGEMWDCGTIRTSRHNCPPGKGPKGPSSPNPHLDFY